MEWDKKKGAMIDGYFADGGITMDDTIILELGIRDQPSFLDQTGSKWIEKVIADCTSIKTCLHHKLILQEGVEVVPDHDGSDVQRIIFLRFSIQGDNHAAGSGDHCCGKLNRRELQREITKQEKREMKREKREMKRRRGGNREGVPGSPNFKRGRTSQAHFS